jgi:hypothetical protein
MPGSSCVKIEEELNTLRPCRGRSVLSSDRSWSSVDMIYEEREVAEAALKVGEVSPVAEDAGAPPMRV